MASRSVSVLSLLMFADWCHPDNVQRESYIVALPQTLNACCASASAPRHRRRRAAAASKSGLDHLAQLRVRAAAGFLVQSRSIEISSKGLTGVLVASVQPSGLRVCKDGEDGPTSDRVSCFVA